MNGKRSGPVRETPGRRGPEGGAPGNAFLRVLDQGLRERRWTPPAGFRAQCRRYLSLLLEWNRVFRLVGYRNEEEIARKLFLDSLVLSPYVPEGARMLDIGSGAGFPGLVLKLFRPDLEMTLVEARAKRVHFLKQVLLELGVAGVSVHGCRLGADPAEAIPRSFYDVVTAKALGTLEYLVEIGSPYLKPSGRIVALKGTGREEPLSAPQWRVRRIPYELPGGEEPRTVVIVERMETRTGEG